MTAIIKRQKNLLPIVLLAGLCIWTTFEILFVKFDYAGSIYDRSFSISNILAFSVVLVDLFVYFFARQQFKYSVLITIILGLIGILNYTANTYLVTFIVSFQPVSLAVGLLYIALNFQRFMEKIEGKRGKDTEHILDLEKVGEFKVKYGNKSIEELEALVEDRRFVAEAKVAAIELLAERKNKPSS